MGIFSGCYGGCMGYRAASLLLVAALAAPVSAANDGAPVPAVVGGEFTYLVRKGDSLASISARFGVSEKVLAQDNRLAPPYRLKAGGRLKVYNLHLVPARLEDGILINIPQRMLFVFRDAKVAASYPVALGRRDWQTPTGSFFVAQREKNKTWIVPPSIQEEMLREGKPVLTRVPPGPGNPLGAHWIGLSAPGYGIHGTNAPASIYRMRTHGCIRLHPNDAEALYEQVSLNMSVEIIYAPVLLGAPADGPIFIEVNPDVYNRGVEPLEVLHEIARASGLEQQIDWTKAAILVRAKDGVAREVGTVYGTEGGENGGTIAGSKSRPAAVHEVRQPARAGAACFAEGTG